MLTIYYICNPKDMKTSLDDWHDGRHRVRIGTNIDSISIVGSLEELAQVFAMGESLVENERIRKRTPPGFQEEKTRAEGR